MQFLVGAGGILVGAACLLGTRTLLTGLDGVAAPAVVAATGAVVVA